VRDSVVIVVPYVHGTLDELRRCVESVKGQDYSGRVELLVINESENEDQDVSEFIGATVVRGPGNSRRRPGGVLLQILTGWMSSDADYMAMLSPTNTIPVDRLRLQTQRMSAESLAASYGDVVYLSRSGIPELFEEAKPFRPEMLGRNCFSIETMMFRRHSFTEAGGFDHVFAAGYRPKAFLQMIAALSGVVERVPTVLLHHTRGPELLEDGLPGESEYQGKAFWGRLRFERLLARARGEFLGGD